MRQRAPGAAHHLAAAQAERSSYALSDTILAAPPLSHRRRPDGPRRGRAAHHERHKRPAPHPHPVGTSRGNPRDLPCAGKSSRLTSGPPAARRVCGVYRGPIAQVLVI